MKLNICKPFFIVGFVVIGMVSTSFAQNDLSRFNSRFDKKPLQDIAADLTDKIGRNIDLTKPFSVALTGILNGDGKFITQKTFFVKSEGDAAMTDLAKRTIAAVNDSGLLIYFAHMGIENLQINFLQNEKEMSADINSELADENKARSVAVAFGFIIRMIEVTFKDSDSQILLSAVKSISKGKIVTISFALPKEEVHRIIKQKLQTDRNKENPAKEKAVLMTAN